MVKTFPGESADIVVIQSNYKDNPFLSPAYVQQLEALVDQDKNFFKIYTLGEWGGRTEGLIYPDFNLIDEMPFDSQYEKYGVDFGFENPTVIVRVMVSDKDLFVDELLYKTHMTNAELIEFAKTLKWRDSFADSAEPQRIEEIRRAGLSCMPAIKDVQLGIDVVKRYNIHITKGSVNLIKEIRSYQRKKDKAGKVLDEPIKFNDHCFDELTDILTENGWKRFSQLEKGERIATLGNDKCIEYQLAYAHIVRDYDGEMYLYQGNNVNFCVTPDHNLYVANQYSAKVKGMPNFNFIKPRELPHTSWVSRIGKSKGGEVIDVLKMELVGFWLAEGCKSYTQGRKYIHLDNKDIAYLNKFKEKFGGSLYSTKGGHRLSIRSDELYDLLPDEKCYSKYIPIWAKKADQEGLKALLDGCIKGDGRVNSKGISIDLTSEKLIDDLQELCFKIGIPTNKYLTCWWRITQTPTGLSWSRPVWRLALSKEKRGTSKLGLTEIAKSKLKVIKYKGRIYCITVPNHIIAVRRNGRIMWSGQCLDALRYAMSGLLTSRKYAFEI